MSAYFQFTNMFLFNPYKPSVPDTPKIEKGLIQLIRIDGSTWQMWVNSNYDVDNVVDPPSGARVDPKIPDWMSNNLAGREK